MSVRTTEPRWKQPTSHVPVRGERDLSGRRVGNVLVEGAQKRLTNGSKRQTLWAGWTDDGRRVYATAEQLWRASQAPQEADPLDSQHEAPEEPDDDGRNHLRRALGLAQ